MADVGQDPITAATRAIVEGLHEAANRRDVDAFAALLADDVVWDMTGPPDGGRHEGKAAVRAAAEEFFRSSPHAHFETEELVALGDRAVEQWVYRWVDRDGREDHIRGVDVFQVRDGKIASMCAYVKG